MASHDKNGINTTSLAKNLSQINNLTDTNNQAIEENAEIILPKVIKLNNTTYEINTDGNIYKYYNTNGLILLLDGINNTRNGHSTTTTTWEDLSGNNNDFNLNNFNTTSSSGWQGESLIFDGENDYLKSTNNFDFNSSKSLTIQFVDLNGTLYTNNDIGNLIIETSKDFNFNPKSFLVNFSEWASKTIGFSLRKPDYNFQNDTEPLIENESISYTLTFNAENEYNNYVQMYKNSILRNINHNTTHNTNLSDFTFNTYPMYIGARGGYSYFTKMRLASVRIYNRVLTEEEIRNSYEVDRVRFNMD